MVPPKTARDPVFKGKGKSGRKIAVGDHGGREPARSLREQCTYVTPTKIATVQRSAVTVTPSGIGKSVTIIECHYNSVTLIVVNESGISKTVTVADCHSNRCHSNRRPL